FSSILVLLQTFKYASSSCFDTSVTSCTPLSNTTTCFGTALYPEFTYTSFDFASDASSLAEAAEKLQLWSGLKAAPKCWEVVQPFLCSVYMPKCDNNTLTAERPSREMCLKARAPCDIVRKISGWPSFLDCDNFTSCAGQSHTYDDITFDMTGQCNSPLVRTENQKSWYSEVEGCGIRCQNPLFTDTEHDQVHIVIAVFGSLCIACTLFTMLTFIIDWKTASHYPALILFFINACFFMGSIGWMAQFSGNARTDIVCKSDGTIRKGEPELGNGETASCTIVFILVYYFMMAGAFWFVMLAFAWYLTFRALGTQRDDLKNKTSYFHIASWCVPLVLTIVCLSVSEIDGDSLSGVCFVGAFNNGYRGGFVLLPVGLLLVIGLVYLILVLKTLINLKKDSPDYISLKALSKIKETIIRLGIFTLLAFLFVVISFVVHIYIFANEHSWSESFKEYIYCQGNTTVAESVYNTTVSCQLSSRPSVVAYGFHIFAFFGAGIAMSSWSWTKASLLAWERFLRKVFNKPSNKPVKLKKHKVIAKAFEKRKELNNGRLSISFASTHDDPLGMKFDLNSVSSNNSMSSDFRAAMPKLVKRRGGMMHPTAGTLRKYSDSDIGSAASKMASRRHSIDSQISAAQGQFRVSDDDEEEMEVEYAQVRKRSKAKKKKKIRKLRRNRILPVLGPISNAMSSSAYGGRRAGRRSRRGSGNSTASRASAHGVDIDVEKNSMEAVSVTSYSHQNSLDAVTLPEPPKHLGKVANFSIFTASAYMGELNAKLKELESTDRSERESIRSWGDRKRRKTETGSVSGYVTSEAEEPPSIEGLVRMSSRRHSSRRSRSGSRHHNSTSMRHDGVSQGMDSSHKRQDSASRHRDSENRKMESSNRRQDSASRRHNSASQCQDNTSRRHDSVNSRQNSASSRQNSANGYMRGRCNDVTLEMAEMFYRQHRQASSATSRTSGRQGSARSTRTASAKSERSVIRQLPGETTAIEIEDIHDPYTSSS
ncbi:protein smoothened-like, partial [Saccostrea cucullata]|uniref:protein smoothened-like n=1 Tax=Saccostrea cuccullata TaxID=36930 RepID=UPI002ED58773